MYETTVKDGLSLINLWL